MLVSLLTLGPVLVSFDRRREIQPMTPAVWSAMGLGPFSPPVEYQHEATG